MKPTLIGIGVQKCASSWAHTALGTHPEIAASNPKEIDYFSYYFDRGHAWYERHFKSAHTDHRFEISPSYFHDPRTPARIRTYASDMRILVLLRDPVERAFSNHLHEIVKGHIPAIPFAEGLPNNPAYIEQGRYGTHLARWLEAFPKEQIHIAFAEDVAIAPQEAAKALYRFLGVAPATECTVLNERRNTSDQARMPAIRNALRTGGSMLRRVGMEEELAKFKALPPVRAVLEANSVNLRAKIPEMDTQSRAKLDAVFAPELHHLAALLGRTNLPWASWHRAQQKASA